jgi:hypothetical protein
MLAQQSVNVTGVITDEKGEGLPGATVQIKGTPRGVSTDVDGSFTISAKPTDVLVVLHNLGHPPTGKAVEEFTNPAMGWEKSATTSEDFFKLKFCQSRMFTLRDCLWPLPTSELNKNKQLIQNPGW